VLRKAQKEASKATYQAAKSNAQSVKKYGYSAKAVWIKQKTYKTTVVTIVGPRSKMVYEKGVYTRGKHKGEARRFRPSFYAHLLEKGSKRSKAKPYLKPALDSTQQQFISTMSAEVAKLIAAELPQKYDRRS
jgi:HK97 gp10 family phage protein